MQHDQPRAHPDQPAGTDIVGGTRAGADNVEPVGKTGIQSGPDVEKAQPVDRSPASDLTNQNGEHAERAAERDERGRS